MKQSGGNLGYGKYADAITRTPQGKFVVNDPAMRREIMALRKDPTANAVMAGAFANSNAKVLNDRLGRKPTDGELYMAHFLGASGAARFIKAAEARPDAKAANFFPRAAQANSSIFYDKQGGARSLKQVYAGLVSRHDGIGTTRVAAVKPVAPMKATTEVAATATGSPRAHRAARLLPRHSGGARQRVGGRAGIGERGGDRDHRRDGIRAGAFCAADRRDERCCRPSAALVRVALSARGSRPGRARGARALGRAPHDGGRDADDGRCACRGSRRLGQSKD